MIYRSISLIVLAVIVAAACSTKDTALAPLEDRTSPDGERATAAASEASDAAVSIKPYVASPTPVAVPDGQSAPPATSPAPAATQPTTPSDAAVTSLISVANNKISIGQYDQAAASLERALRRAPKNAEVLSKLAEVHLLQKDYTQAEVVALKSNALAKGNKSLLAKNWRTISKSRRLRGDSVGADEAEAQAYQNSK